MLNLEWRSHRTNNKIQSRFIVYLCVIIINYVNKKTAETQFNFFFIKYYFKR